MPRPTWGTIAISSAASFVAGMIVIAVFLQRPGRPGDSGLRVRAASLAPTEVTPASPPPIGAARIGLDPIRDLQSRQLAMPVRGVSASALFDSFEEARAGGRHEAIDILAPRNTAVVAVEDGVVAKLFESRAGGTTIYQFDPTSTYVYYYAHLERYADRLQEGLPVRRGDLIGYVGSSGNAPETTPHLHFAIFKLGAEKKWWEGTPIDPYYVLR